MNKVLEIWLADDDQDDCTLFQSAVEQIAIPFELKIVYNGEQLMESLNQSIKIPDILFLDLNMPRKNGFTCLTEIKKSDRLKTIPVVILSTSCLKMMVDQLYDNGAQHFIRKPNDFFLLKRQVDTAIRLVQNTLFDRRSKDQFIIAEPSHLNEKT